MLGARVSGCTYPGGYINGTGACVCIGTYGYGRVDLL